MKKYPFLSLLLLVAVTLSLVPVHAAVPQEDLDLF